MLARVLAMAMCPCLSVCLSRVGVETDKRIGLVLAWELPSTYPTLCYKEIQVSSKIGYFRLELWTWKNFSNTISIVEACYRYQLSSTKVDAQSVINWAVVSQLS